MVRARGLLGPASVVIVLAASGAALVRGGTSVRDVAAYGLYFLGCVALPGVLAYRALRGPGPWWEDVAMGAAFGLCLELISWAVLTSLHLQRWLIVPPILSLALLAHPHNRLRRNTQAGVDRWPAWLVANVGAASLVLLGWLVRYAIGKNPDHVSSAPPYIDLLWHEGLVAAAGRGLPLIYPEVTLAGPVRYHWFSHAHMSVAHRISGVDVDTILTRTYAVPLGLLTVVCTAALARSITRSHTAAALASWLVIAPMTLAWWPTAAGPIDIFPALSPSQIYSAPILLLAVSGIVSIIRKPLDRRAWLVAAAAVLASSGAKASALPLLVGGLVLALVAALVLRRGGRVMLGLTVVVGVVLAIAAPFLAGSTSGSHLQLLSNLRVNRLPLYRTLVGAPSDTGGLLPAGFFGPGGAGVTPLLVLTALLLIQMAKAWIWIPALFAVPKLRQDPIAWLLGGISLGGVVAMLVLYHPGSSALYFLFGALPFGSVLGAWVVTEALASLEAKRASVVTRRAVAVGAAISLAGVACTWKLPVPTSIRGHELLAVGVLGVLAGLCLAVGVWGWRRGRYTTSAGRQLSAGVLAAATVGAMAVSGPLLVIAQRPTVARTGARIPAAPPTPGAPAASWIDRSRVGEYVDQHLPEDTLLATNAHCAQYKDGVLVADRYGSPRGCYSVQFWVSGFTLRQVLVSGWAYSTAVNKDQTFTQPEALAKNDAFFSAPSRSGLDYLHSQGVTYIVASLSNGPVSPAIASYADMVLRTPTVWLLKLKS